MEYHLAKKLIYLLHWILHMSTSTNHQKEFSILYDFYLAHDNSLRATLGMIAVQKSLDPETFRGDANMGNSSTKVDVGNWGNT